MAIWSPLTTNWAVNLQDSTPRNAPVMGVQNHHTATNNKLNALALFAPGGREVTPNYFVAGREIWGIVPEDRRAYTSGSSYDDNRAITMEILNLTNAPDWQFAADTIATVVLLNADIARRYGVPLQHSLNGIYEHRNINDWTGRSYATACAGPSFNVGSIIAAVAASNTSPAAPEEEDEEMNRPICIAKPVGGSNVEVTIFSFDTGEEHVYSSTSTKEGIEYNRNVAMTYGCAPQAPVSYITASHYDKIKSENAATRKRLAARA